MKYFALVFCFVLNGCSSLLYYPTPYMYFEPEQFNLIPIDVWFKTEAGDDVHGWLIESKKKPSLGTLVFFHGNAQNLSAHYANLIWLPDMGYSYFIFDYPGYGQSPGEPTPKNTVQTGKAAIKWVYENVDKRPIVFGSSLGGAIAQRAILEVKNEIPLRAVVLDSTFTSYRQIGRQKLSTHWLTWLFQPLPYLVLSDAWAADKDDLKKISPIPTLVIHGEEDEIVDFQFGEEIYDNLAEPKQFWKIPEGGHTDAFWIREGENRERFVKWLNDHK